MKLITLSKEFYSDYKNCSEILEKESRPYVCLVVEIEGAKFAIPFRHNVSHKYSFKTYESCGLDYTKAIVVIKEDYVSNHRPQIEQKEYNLIKGKENKIAAGMRKYVELYKKAKANCNSHYYSNILKYSTLQYFEKYIGVPSNDD